MTMKLLRLLAISITIFLAPHLSGRETVSVVAIISEIQGEANVILQSKNPRALELFEWLPAGALIKIDKNSRAIVAFHNGSRYELSAGAEVTLLEDKPKIRKGSVKALEPFPPIPRFAVIAEPLKAGVKSGAIRIRGDDTFSWLYPRSGNATLPQSTLLVFAAIPDASRYRVIVKRETGETVFDRETTETEVPIPEDVIFPGERYSWSVTAFKTQGLPIRGFGEFLALDSETAKVRMRLKQTLEMKGDSEALAFLAAVDRRLGLLLEAWKEFGAAYAVSDGNPAIRSIVDEIGRQFDASPETPKK